MVGGMYYVIKNDTNLLANLAISLKCYLTTTVAFSFNEIPSVLRLKRSTYIE